LVVEDLQLLEQLEAGIVIMDGAGVVVRWNAHAERILGLPADKAIGRPWAELLSIVRDGEIVGGDPQAVALGPGGWHGLVHLRLATGGDVRVRAHVQAWRLSSAGKRPGVAAVFWADPGKAGDDGDPTLLPYRDLFRRSPEALVLTDLEGTIIDANDAAAALHGRKRGELIGHSYLGDLQNWSAEQTEAAQSETMAAGSIVREITLRRPAGDSVQLECIGTIVSPTERGYVLIRMRDLARIDASERVLRDLGRLSRLSDEPMAVEEVARRVLEIVAESWPTAASLIVLQNDEGFSVVPGPNTPETVRAAFGGLDPADSPLARRIREAERPFEIEFDDATAPEWAERGRALGMKTLYSTPLWSGDRTLGAIILLAPAEPDLEFEPLRLEQLGRHAGMAIGHADLRETIRREAVSRASLEDLARTGGVVLSQITEAIVATDAGRLVTAVNPAAERLYGFRAEEVIGKLVEDVVEQFEADGSPLSRDWVASLVSAGYWRGRAIHRPLIGPSAGRNIVVDLSTTVLHDERRRFIGMVGLSREVAPSSDLDSDAVALAALSVATSRARTRGEVASAVLERLCEVTMADIGLVALWGEGRTQTIEASRGLSEEALETIRTVSIPGVREALYQPAAIVSVESIGEVLAGTDAWASMTRSGVATGFLAAMHVRDDSIGFLGLASRRAAWMRPRDEVVLQIATQVANAIDSALLMERLETGLEQERHLTAQLDAVMGLTLLPQGDVSEDAVAQLLLDRIVGALGADSGCVLREDADSFRVVATHGMPAEAAAVFEARHASEFELWQRLMVGPAAGAFRMPLSQASVMDPAFDQFNRLAASLAVFPIREADRLVGAFLCYFSRSDAVSQADERNLEAVGRIISIAYANVRMSEGLAEAAEHERRLRAELQALQELTLLGASTDDLTRLAEETIQEVVLATGASGGGYILVDPSSAKVDPITWVGLPSQSWPETTDQPQIPSDWPPFAQMGFGDGVWLSQSDEEAGADSTRRAQAVLPLRVDDRLAGVLHLEWSESPRSEQYDAHFLEPIARICSISLANFRLRSELLHRAAAQRALGHRLDTLDELTRIGEEASSFEELANRTVSLVREALNAVGVCYLLIEPGHHLETHAVAGETGAFRLWLKGVPAKDAPGGSLLLSGSGSVLGDFVANQVNERVLPLARATGFRSFGAIPIQTGEELAGALLCFFDQPAATLPLDESALDSVARIAGIALANYRLRERLVSSEERYRTLFEESPEALLVSALDGTVLDANEAAVRLYRVSRGEVLGRYFGQLIAADEREMARRRQIVWAQGRGTFRDRGRRSDASEFPVEVEIRVVELGGQRRFLHLVRDLSDQERLQRELLQAQKMEAIGQLVSGVAHELNNPLAAIIAFSQLLRSDERLPDDMKHDAGLLVQEADRTRRIVQNLLDFARARPPERRPTSITVLVQSVLELQSYALNTNQIVVKVEIPASLPEVDLDRAQLQQVLLNLTINAIQAIRGRDRKTPAHLWVSAGLVKTRSSSGLSKAEKLFDDQARVRITIRDDGPGVPESARARLFDPFFTTKQPGEGTGLGLSVSFGIVAAHGGHLWYEPGPGGLGSSFVIELPVSARGVDELELAASLAHGGGPGLPTVGIGPERAGSAQPTRRPASRAVAPEVAPRVAAKASLAPAPGARTAAAPAARAARATPTPAATAESTATTPPVAAQAVPAAKAAAQAVPAAKAVAHAEAKAAAHAEATAPAAPPTDSVAGPATRRPRVLAVDDEPSIRAFLRKALTAAGMDCLPFQDGAQALEGVCDGTFDVMLIDHRMAGMSGTEFYEAAIECRPELTRRAVFMSGDVLNPDLRGFAMQHGIRLLAKPFDIDAVIRIVREALADAEAAEATSKGSRN
jgi:PAS domain S-box-containing protein